VEANRAQGLTILDREKLAVINFKTEDFFGQGFGQGFDISTY